MTSVFLNMAFFGIVLLVLLNNTEVICSLTSNIDNNCVFNYREFAQHLIKVYLLD